MALITSGYWGFSLTDEPLTIDERVGPNTLTSSNFVDHYSPTSVAARSGPPIGQNDLVDFNQDPDILFKPGPFRRSSWVWFLEQVRALAIVGDTWKIPAAQVYVNSEIAWLHQSAIDSYSKPQPYYPARLDAQLLFGIHDLLNQVNAIKLEPRPVVWSKPWFEQAIEILRNGWAWKHQREWSQSFLTWPMLVGGSVSAGESLLGVQLGPGFYAENELEVMPPAGFAWGAGGSAGPILNHEYTGDMSVTWRAYHDDPQFPAHVTSYRSECAVGIKGPGEPKTASGTGHAYIQTGATTVGTYFSSGAAQVSVQGSGIAPTYRDPDSFTFTEIGGPA